MWHTSQGTRTLAGHEAELFLETVGHLRDMVSVGFELGESFQSEIALFNSLQPTQQLALLHEVAFGLLDPEVLPPDLNAALEATIHVLFRELLSLIEIEIDLNRDLVGGDDEEPGFLIRTAILLAYEEVKHQFSETTIEAQAGENLDSDGTSINEPLPDVDCDEIERWEGTIEQLSDQILWDRDFEFDDLLANGTPRKIGSVKELMGIDENYFATPVPDVCEKKYRHLDRELVELTSAMRPLFDNSDEWLPGELGELDV